MSADIAAGALTVKQHCFEILTSGHPHAFQDFFELTHHQSSNASNNSQSYEETQMLSCISLPLVRRCLMTAEAATAKGEMGSVYMAYRELAEHMEAAEQDGSAIGYYAKCLDIARDVDHRALQIEAYERLGCAHEHALELLQAIASFEKQAVLAESDADVQRATTHLREVYWKRAEQSERDKEYEGAVRGFEQVVRAAQTLGDVRWEGQACYRLGLVYARTDAPTTALPHLHKHREICQQDGDRVGEGEACCALAEAYQAVGDTTAALAHLEAFLAVADCAEAALKARACCSLGVIYGAQEDWPRSLAYLEQFFALATTTADLAMIDAARTHLGRARARVTMGAFMSSVAQEERGAQSLLAWKLDRVPLPTTAPGGWP